jgi:toxin ParE1/3/4
MGQVRWTPEAASWLAEIFEHIAKDNPEAARRTVRGIYEKAQILADFPEIGHRFEGASEPVRILLYGHFRIAYLVEGSSRDVSILGVFHGALDIDRYL